MVDPSSFARTFTLPFMKPTPQIIISHSSKDDQRPNYSQLGFPKLDYAYQTNFPDTAVAGSRNATTLKLEEARAFRSISRHFITDGSMREYVAEALFFAWITLTAAWPLYLLVRALSMLTARP
jgi:hypothetical protein